MYSKFNILLLSVLMFLGACENKTASKHLDSVLHQLSDSLSLDKSKNIVFYSINPNDCINCLRGFADLHHKLVQTKNQKVYVMLTEREIEKEEVIKTTKGINFTDSVEKVVVWDKKLFQKISASTGHKILISLLTIYNYNADSVLYSKPIKSIDDRNELKPFLVQ